MKRNFSVETLIEFDYRYNQANRRKTRNKITSSTQNARTKIHVQRYFMQGHARLNRNQPEID